MAETSIGWTATQLPDGTLLPGYTFNAWIGCTKLTAACDNCYAETYGHRFGVEWGPHERRRTSESYWRQPLGWNRKAERDGVRRKVFCCSLADVFDNQVDPQWRIDLFRLIGVTPHLDWLLLTKRPQNIAKMLPSDYVLAGNPPANVWLGTTTENQEEADRRIPHLLAVPARIHFLSAEPLLGLIDLTTTEGWLWRYGGRLREPVNGWADHPPRRGGGIDWVITGGESGPNARDNDFLVNARSLLGQCRDAGVPFFGKQNVKKSPLPGDLMVREFPDAR